MAERLTFLLGMVAPSAALQNAFDARSACDTEAEAYWLDVLDLVRADGPTDRPRQHQYEQDELQQAKTINSAGWNIGLSC
jgi:hypothetical protein